MVVSPLLDTSKVIVGQSGLGKTVTAKHDVAQLLEQRRHVAIVDPLGVWWGMRHNAAGDGPGFPLPIFGGEHGDLPIGPNDGAAIARVIVEQRRSAIVDLSSIHNGRDWRTFMADFVAELRKKPAGNFHLVVDEADEFAPERPSDNIGFALREDMEWIAKRGRVRGFVPTYITQRTAEIAWAVISQVKTVIVHGLVAPNDQQPIEKYLKSHASAETRKEVMASLAELEIGERWIYSPRLKILERGFTPPLTTFDSSRTPEAGEVLVEPRALAPVDVTAIRAALAPSDRAEGTIPAGAGAEAAAMVIERDRRIRELMDEKADLLSKLSLLRGSDEELGILKDGLATITVAMGHVFNGRRIAIHLPGDANLHSRNADSGVAPEHRSAAARELPPVSAAEVAPPADDNAGERIAGGAADSSLRGRKALLPLARIYPAGLSEPQWATMAGLTRSGGTWKTYRGALFGAGLVDHHAGLWFATEAGVAAAGVSPAPLPAPGPDLARHWGALVPGARRLTDILIKRWPYFTTADALASDVGMVASGGTFKTYLGRMRGNGLLQEQAKKVRLSPSIMGDA